MRQSSPHEKRLSRKGIIVGTIAEIKNHEYRVGLTPSCVHAYVRAGHQALVQIQKDAGKNAGFFDQEYIAAGAEIVDDRVAICDRSDMIVKVKEPITEEYDLFHEGLILYTYLHLAADKSLTEMLLTNKIKSVAHETIEDNNGHLPCLRPMSEIAGRFSAQEGAKYMEKTFGGRGVLLGGIPGACRGKIVIIGGANACKMAIGIGAEVTILDVNGNRLAYLDDIFGSSITTLYSHEANVEQALSEADVAIGAMLVACCHRPRRLF